MLCSVLIVLGSKIMSSSATKIFNLLIKIVINIKSTKEYKMTQKSLAEQVAEMQNNLTALDKILNTKEKRISSIIVKYNDGTAELFSPTLKRPTENLPEQKVVEARTPRLPNFKEGYACIINGKKYLSIMHASRVLKICRHRVKANIEAGYHGWEFV
jgi:hypothetical protein